jgi:ribose/xylose/arabinose/galactoside ABC-type transport system permease subunit
VLAAIAVWLTIRFPDFRTGANLSVLLSGIAEVAIVAAGMTLVIATGGIDISVGSVVGFSGVVLGVLVVEKQWGLLPALIATCLAGTLCGAVNGVLIARFKVPPIIATLAGLSAARAGAYILSDGNSLSGLPDAMVEFGLNNWMGVPKPAWLAAGILFFTGLLLKKTSIGRSILALGGSREATYLSGIRTANVELLVYALCGLLAAVSAIVVTARGATATPDAGKGFELTAITAVVMGGTPVSGGRATIWGTVLGMLAIALVQNGVISYGGDGVRVQLVLGAVLLLSVEVDRWRTRRNLKA